jgi:hypothetical protein
MALKEMLFLMQLAIVSGERVKHLAVTNSSIDSAFRRS